MSESTAQSQMPKTGEFSWNELLTTDTSAAQAFYTRLFGWKAEPFNPGGANAGGHPYLVFKTSTSPMGVAGMMASPQPGAPASWHAYVVVQNVDATLAQATKLSGKVLLPGTDIPGVGRVAMLQDPQGAVIGIHQLPS